MEPLISCVMPTRNRPEFARDAVSLFLAQSYENRELVIADDWGAPSFPEPPEHPMVRYLQAPAGLTLGAKRNWVNEQARGEIIAHWDDDDWYAPDRLMHQYRLLAESYCDLVGYGDSEFRSDTGAQWLYRARPDYVLGATMMYWKPVWERRHFPEDLRHNEERQVGSDTRWIHRQPRMSLVSVPAGEMFFARNHGANLNDRNDAFLAGQPTCWERVA